MRQGTFFVIGEYNKCNHACVRKCVTYLCQLQFVCHHDHIYIRRDLANGIGDCRHTDDLYIARGEQGMQSCLHHGRWCYNENTHGYPFPFRPDRLCCKLYGLRCYVELYHRSTTQNSQGNGRTLFALCQDTAQRGCIADWLACYIEQNIADQQVFELLFPGAQADDQLPCITSRGECLADIRWQLDCLYLDAQGDAALALWEAVQP